MNRNSLDFNNDFKIILVTVKQDNVSRLKKLNQQITQ